MFRYFRASHFLLTIAVFVLPAIAHAALKIGVTLHPYYSFVANIAGQHAEVVPLISEGFNPHAYEPRAEDIKRIGTLDVIVLNAIGHDDFALKMIAASQRPDIPVIRANADVPLLSGMALGTPQGRAVNPHTFLSISASMIQVNTITRALAELDPSNAAAYQSNARDYNRRLRQLRADAMRRIGTETKTDFHIATEHGAYDYLLHEFGLEVSAVVEPAHGMEPSPSQLKTIIELMRKKNIKVLFSEQDNASPYVKTLVQETAVRVYPLTHITHGAYSAEKFEQDMARNLDAVVRAIQDNAQ